MMRPATLEDVPALVEMGAGMAAESPRWNRLTYSGERVGNTLRNLIESPDGLVLVGERSGGLIAGGIAAIASPNWMSEEMIVQELALFVRPEFRGSILACRLICGLAEWAKLKGARWVEAGVSTGVSPERTAALYQRLGFKAFMVGLELEIPNGN
ncbi:N-acetyltransferase family protein [Castellaniella ginsengisoli]|uniref:GNAT family N-acetyltransferase n=1 Tax=Castellaniella ginsengisoli TaxID=546114 RepID=A0AB39DNT6_9BURK